MEVWPPPKPGELRHVVAAVVLGSATGHEIRK